MSEENCSICGKCFADLPKEGCEDCGMEHDPLAPDFNQALNFNDPDRTYNPYDYVPDNLVEPTDEDL